MSIFGKLFKPVWSLEFWNPSTQEHFALQSDSVGALLGFIAVDLEKGLRLSAKWVVQLVHRSLKRVSITHHWPDDSQPVSQVLAETLHLDAKLRKTKKPPQFYRFDGATKVRLPISASLDGRQIVSMSIEERVQLKASGRDSSASKGVFDVVRSAFTERFGVESALAGQIVYQKIDW